MKKIISVVTALVMSLLCMVPAFADMEGPEFKSYDAYIKDPAGWTYVDEYTDVPTYIPYNTKITVTGEYDGKAWFLYDDNYFEISLDEITKVKSEVDMSEAKLLDHPVTYIVISDEGAKIRKGPAESYDETGTVIPKDTQITVTYGSTESAYYLPWAYFTYNGISGWVYVEEFEYGYDFATKLTYDSGRTGKTIVLRDGLRLTDIPGEIYESSGDDEDYVQEYQPEYISDEIPAGTEFSYDTYYECAKCVYVFVEYNGVKGWLESGDCYNGIYSSHSTDDSISSTFIYGGSADIYSERFNGGEKLGTIPADNAVLSYLRAVKLVSPDDGSEIQDYAYDDSDYDFMDSYYVEYNGINGWITAGYGAEFSCCLIEYCDKIKITADTECCADKAMTEKTAVIPEGTETYILDSFYENGNDVWLILYNGKPVYINEADNFEYGQDDTYADSDEIETLLCGAPLEIDYSIVNFEAPETESEDDDIITTAEQDTSAGVRTTVIIILVAAAVICLASAVTIVFIRKKKNMKKAETVTEENNE